MGYSCALECSPRFRPEPCRPDQSSPITSKSSAKRPGPSSGDGSASESRGPRCRSSGARSHAAGGHAPVQPRPNTSHAIVRESLIVAGSPATKQINGCRVNSVGRMEPLCSLRVKRGYEERLLLSLQPPRLASPLLPAALPHRMVATSEVTLMVVTSSISAAGPASALVSA